jgi:hypothetical protein
MKDNAEPIVMVTAYDTPTARWVDRAGVDVILVGDSLGMVVSAPGDPGHDGGHSPPHGGGAAGAAARSSPPACSLSG